MLYVLQGNVVLVHQVMVTQFCLLALLGLDDAVHVIYRFAFSVVFI